MSTPGAVELKIRTGGSHFITDLEIAALQTDYPALDVNQEIHQAKAWLDANPSKRPTPVGAKRFIAGWLNRSQDRLAARSAHASAGAPQLAPIRSTPSELSPRVQDTFDRFLAEGLLPPDYKPRGDSDHELIASIRSKATVEFFRLNPNQTSLGCTPGTTRSTDWLPEPSPTPPPPVVATPRFQKALVRADKAIPSMEPPADTPPPPTTPPTKAQDPLIPF